jgi:uncharacterized protein YndB with AHSA1/START domain/predicted enzyme related to lactoylglutathione lyase
MPTDSATALVLRRTFCAPREQLFAAWTTPATLKQFFGPGDVIVLDVQIDLRVGGAYHIVMRKPDGEEIVARGIYRELVSPERIVCTWTWDEDDPALEKETLLTLEFVERGDATDLILTHEGFRDAQQCANHEAGWSTILDQIAAGFRPLNITGMDVSGYMVKDAQRAIAFYRDVLGLEPARIYPENRGAEYDLPDGTTFALWGGGGKVMPFQPSNGILFAVADVDKAVAALRARNVTIVKEIETPACRMAALNDSEGNTVFLHARRSRA